MKALLVGTDLGSAGPAASVTALKVIFSIYVAVAAVATALHANDLARAARRRRAAEEA